MILPTTYEMTLLLLAASMICWGSWANTFKLAGKWRFELYYFDYSLGVLLAAVVAAFTFGSMGDELSFLDNLAITSKTQLAYAVGAGVIFNLANMLLVGAISIAGMAVAFPIGIGLALIVGVVWNYLLDRSGNVYLLFGGVALVLLAIILDAMAYRGLAASQAKVGATGNKKSARAPGILKGVLLSLVSGVLMGSFYPIIVKARAGDFGLGPYTVAVMFALGVFFSTFVFNLYFMNLPIQGEAVDVAGYFRGTMLQHSLGILGGIIWCTGAVANFVAATPTLAANARVGPAVSYGLGQGATMVSVIWGLLVWREFKGASGKVNVLLALMFVCFGVGLYMIAIAPR